MSRLRLTATQRAEVFQRARGCCEYCQSQAKFSPDPFSIEHILPRSKGGTNASDNLALACQGCNNYKYNYVNGRDPINGIVVPLYHPRRDKWTDHFTWSEDFRLVLGLTPIGRATVEQLQLNRGGVVNLRSALRAINRHPP
jgi:5-methylcytosine-specific restriction endonuclease McrA